MSDGMGVRSDQSVQFQPPGDAEKNQSSDQVGKSSTGRTVSSTEGKNTKGLVITAGTVKPDFKSSPLEALADRVIQKSRQKGKTWVKVSDSQLTMLNKVKNTEVKNAATSAVNERNRLVQQLQSLESEVVKLEIDVSTFKKDFGEALKFRDKSRPASADFKLNKSIVYPTADGKAEVRSFTSDAKSNRKEKAVELLEMLKNDEGIKARFSKHNENKHDLAEKKKEIAGIKKQLVEEQKQTKSSLSKAVDQLYKEKKEDLKTIRDSGRKGAREYYESHRDTRKQNYNKTKQELRAELDDKHDDKVKVRQEKDQNKQALKELDKQIKGSESRVGDFAVNVAKKYMSEDQKEAVFNDSTSAKNIMSEKKKNLTTQRDNLQKTIRDQKEQIGNLKGVQESIKDDLWEQRSQLKGINKLQGNMKRLGIRTNLGRQAWGDLGKLKGERDQRLDQIKEVYKASKAGANKARKQNKQAFKDLANGKLKESAEAVNSRDMMRPVLQFSGDMVLHKFRNNAFKQDREWKTDISELIQKGEPKDVRLVEDTLRLWTKNPENADDFTDVLKFISDQRKSGSP